MRKYLPLVGISLSLCLFIYIFYRTEKTVVNQLVLLLVDDGVYRHWKTVIHDALPLKPAILYSLPEGLWVFCITLTSRFFHVAFLWYRLDVAVIPMILAVTMELFQLFNISNGRFDPVDLLFAFVFWLSAYLFTDAGNESREVRLVADFDGISCVLSYGIVYFAHVIK